MKLNPFLCAALALCGLSAQAAPNGSGAALNLSPYEYYAETTPTVDLMKKSSAWLTQCSPWDAGNTCSGFSNGAGNWDTLEQSKLDLDESGWVKSLPAAGDKSAKYRYVTTIVLPGGIKPGNYVVRYDGAGTIGYGGSGKKVDAQSRAGRDVVLVPAGSTDPTWISITATQPGNHLRNIRVYAPGGVCGTQWTVYAPDASACAGKGSFLAFENFPANQIFHPRFLADLQGFRTLRFMDWLGPMTNPSVKWSERTRYQARTWAGANTGTPYRTIFALTRQVGANPWVTLPTYIDDDYARQFGRMAVKQLGAGATLYLEYSNEPWNYMFPSSHWMKDQAVKTWTPTAEVNAYMLQTNWYGKRSAEICQLVKAEFGAAAGRVKCVQNTQAANSWNADYGLQCPVAAKTLGKSCDKFFDVVAVAPYFGDYINDPKFRSTVASWYSLPDGGVSKLFEELTGTDAAGKAITPPLAAKGSGAPKGALALSAGWMVDNAKIAAAHGLPMIAYEGGQHLVAGGDAAYGKLVATANRDPRMGAAYKRMVADWQRAGGQTFAFYSHMGFASQYGAWGLKNDPFDDQAPKWQSVLPVRDGACWWPGCTSQP